MLPYDRLGEDDIHVYGDHVRIDLKDGRWASFTPTS